MAKIYELMQDRAKVTASIREMMDAADGREMTGEENAALTKAEAEFDKLDARIATEERQLARERAAGETADKEKKPEANTQSTKFAAALTGNQRHIDQYRAEFTLGNDEQAGSLTAPMEFRDQLIKGLDNMLIIRTLANVLPPIGKAQSLGFPQRVTEATDAEWVGEVATAPEETTLSFGRREFKPNRMAKLLKVSETLVSHSSMAQRTLLDEMAYRIGATLENAYMTGDGNNKPLGLFTASANGIPTSRDIDEGNTATAVTFDGLISAKYALKQQYLANAQWITHRDLAKMLAKIKDSDGQYIWQPSVALGAPDLLLGLPVNMSEYAPNTYTAGQYAALLGNYKYYWIADADVLTVKVLKELYATNNMIGYLLNYFGDGAPVLGEAFARVKLGAA